MKFLKKALLLFILIIILIILWKYTPLSRWLNLAQLFQQKEELLLSVQKNILIASIVYILAYITVVALSVPGATLLTLTGGFLFGPWLATLLINLGATTGALLIFIAARYFLGSSLQKKYSTQLERFNKEVKSNGKFYFLTLRFIPLFPFFLINLLAGLTSISTLTFLWTTSLGIIPGSFVYAYLGFAGASIEEGQLVPPQVIIALVLLGIISLVPVIFNKRKKK